MVTQGCDPSTLGGRTSLNPTWATNSATWENPSQKLKNTKTKGWRFSSVALQLPQSKVLSLIPSTKRKNLGM